MNWDQRLEVHPLFSEPYQVDVPHREGGHGGGDPLMQEQLFSINAQDERLGRNAGHGQGAASVLIGVAANRSFETGAPVLIRDLCPELGNPDNLRDLV